VRTLRPVAPLATFRALLAAALATVGVIGLGAAPAAATAEPTGQCTTTSGVIVAVDFRAWGGPLLRSCGSTPTTGYDLLNQGGWHTTGTSHDGPTFICRIGYAGYAGGTGYPTPATESCIVTPPATAYWSYWRAGPGQHSWSYSQVGPAADQPAPGSVELWTFGATDVSGAQGVPTVSPDALRNHSPTPPSTAPPTKPATHPASPGPVTASSSRAETPARSGSRVAGAGPVAPKATGAGPGTGSGPAASAAVAGGAVDAQPASAPAAAGGSPLALIGGLGLVALLGAAAGLVRWRRRLDRS
jgi:hypothetical protein